MNSIEKFIYDLVKHNPRLKTLLRNQYQKVFDLFPTTTKIETSLNVEVRKGFFFGFHDQSPFSYKDKFLLANRNAEGFFMPVLGDELEIGVFTGSKWCQYEPITTTKAWNWHMGCRLQWISGTNSFLFNDFADGAVKARLWNLDTGKDKWFDYPISSVSNDGKYFLSYDYGAIENLMPGYGYKVKDQPYFIPRTISGLNLVSCKSGASRNLIKPGQLLSIGKKTWHNDTFHFLSHTQISPCSMLIAFLHRWITDENDIRKRKSRLLICDLAGKVVLELPTNGMVSHFCWVSSDQILAFCSSDMLGTCYHLFEFSDPLKVSVAPFTDLKADGHPSYNAYSSKIVTDTYPNRLRMQDLYVVDPEQDHAEKVASFYMPKEFQSPSAYSHWSVDLHPRWSRAGDHICVDSAFSGVRSLITLEMNK